MSGSGILIAGMVVMMALMCGGMVLGVGASIRRRRRQRRPANDTDGD